MLKNINYIALLILLFLFSSIIPAQTGGTIIIEGLVESNDGSPIENAKVKIYDLSNSSSFDSTTTDLAGFFHLEIATVTDVKDSKNVPNSISLSQNYPNPFSRNTNIIFTTEKEGNVKLEIFNIIGQKVNTLFDKYTSPSKFLVNWDGRNFNGRKIAKGMYIYRLTYNNKIISKKMLYTRGDILGLQTSNSGTKIRINNTSSLYKTYFENKYHLRIEHPEIVAINDTLETNSLDSTYVVNYSTVQNFAPTAEFVIQKIGTNNFNFSGQGSSDDHDNFQELQFQCDLNEDGIPDIPGGAYEWQQNDKFSNNFSGDGPWNVGIRVKDSDGAISDWNYKSASNNFSTYPSEVISYYDQWKITLGSGSSVSNLINYKHDDYFYSINDGNEWVAYKTPNSGGTTPNSSNTRSELRQFSEWTPETGGKLTGTLKVMHVSTSGDARVPATFSTVVGQIHSSEGHENEPLKIYYKKFPGHTKGSVFWNYEINTEGSNSERWDYSTAVWGYDWSVVGSDESSYPEEPSEGIELGEEFSYEVNVYNGVMYLTFTSDNHTTKTFTKNLISSQYTNYSDIPQQVLTVFGPNGQDGTEQSTAYSNELQYFKQGAYNQTNGKDPSDNMVWNTGAETYNGNLADQYAKGSYTEVWFKEASVGPGTAP